VLNLIIAEAALELVPPEISHHASVRNDARRNATEPSRILLDRSTHHHAMLKLDEVEKRGRPDLVHLTLLSITSSPLYRAGKLRVYIHTRADVVLELSPQTRPPKSYARFRDLMQQLLEEEPDTGLITVFRATLPELIRKKIGADYAIGLSTQGRSSTLEKVAAELAGKHNPAVLIGGFPKGHFAPETIAALDETDRVHTDSLDAHVVAARLVYELERLEERGK
jgi:rRNA small subunit pseudouridine methyltransferase Nep1